MHLDVQFCPRAGGDLTSLGETIALNSIYSVLVHGRRNAKEHSIWPGRALTGFKHVVGIERLIFLYQVEALR